jgi:hypothetical protein
LITQAWSPSPPNPPTAHPVHLRVYVSPTLDELHEEAGWIFVRDGQAFAAVHVVAGGYSWSPGWQHGEGVTPASRAFVVAKDPQTPVILIVNRAVDYGGDFDAFQRSVQAQEIHFEQGVLRFATITFHGPARLPEINRRTIDLAPPRGYDSPFIRSQWNSGLIYLRKGDTADILDFRDPDRPRKIVGAPITPDFPPGVGQDAPIIFADPAK